MTLEDRIRNHINAADVEIAPADVTQIVKAGKRRKTRNQVGAAIAGGVLALGAVFGTASILQNDEPEQVATEELPNDNVATTVDQPPVEDSTAGFDSEDAPEGSTLAAGSFDVVIGTSKGFAGLRVGESGVVAIQSDDGVEWTETPTTGLPNNSELFATRLEQSDDGTFIVVIDSGTPAPLGAGPSEFFVGTSADLIDWSGELVSFADLDDLSAYTAGFGVVDGNFIGIFELFEAYNDPMGVFVDLGLISESDLERSCGWDFRGPGMPIALLSCDFDGEFEDEAGEPNYEGALLVVQPGDPGYDEFVAAIEEDSETGFEHRSAAVTGPLGGPYVTTELDLAIDGILSVTSTNETIVLVTQGAVGTEVLTSTDGIDYSFSDLTLPDFGTIGVTAAGNLISARASGFDVVVSRSTDTASWEEIVIPRETEIYSDWVNHASGAAGEALLVMGPSTEFDDEEFTTDLEPVVIEIDGFTITFDFAGALMVVDADGQLVHEILDWTTSFDEFNGEPGVYAFEGPNDDNLIFFEPGTDVPLVTVTEDQFTSAMEERSGFSSGEAFEDEFPSSTLDSALLVSADDGVTWRELTLPSDIDAAPAEYSLVAVGDDEVLLTVFSVPTPDDLEPGEFSSEESFDYRPQYVRVPFS